MFYRMYANFHCLQTIDSAGSFSCANSLETTGVFVSEQVSRSENKNVVIVAQGLVKQVYQIPPSPGARVHIDDQQISLTL